MGHPGCLLHKVVTQRPQPVPERLPGWSDSSLYCVFVGSGKIPGDKMKYLPMSVQDFRA